MQRNLAWPIFLSVVSLFVVVFTSLLSIDLYRYHHRGNSSPVKEIEASVFKVSNNRYQIELDYLYLIQGKEYSRHQLLKKTTYKNVWLANQAIDSIKVGETPVWYHPNEPQLGTLEKAFPYRRLFSTIVLFGIFIYFCFLGKYMLTRI